MTRPRNFARLAARGVRGLQPYLPGKPVEEVERDYGITGAIKLASNENPLGPSPRALEALQASIGRVALYPDGSGLRLRHALAAHLGVAPEQISLRNGSNDVRVLLAGTFLGQRTEAAYSQYAFLVYPIAVQATGATARVAPANPPGHRQPLGHDLTALRELVGPKTRLVFIANPNNPTGTWLGRAELRAFVESVPPDVIVVLDEAYVEYIDGLDFPDSIAWIAEFPNLVVTRTFSKAYGLAGLRVGYCVGHPGIAELLNRVRQPFNTSSPGQAAALAALADQAHVAEARRANRAAIAQLSEGLGRLGIAVPASAGNFVLADLGRPAAPVYEALLRAGVIVRPVANYGLPNHLRITTGLPAENARLLETLGRVAG
jgi:histidinol-phosphate aminotransferase